MKRLPYTLLLASPALAATTNLTPVHDATVWHRDGNTGYTEANTGSDVDLDIYRFDGNLNAMSYVQFDLSTIPVGSSITSVTFTLTKLGSNPGNGLTGSDRSDTLVTGRIDIFGLNSTAGNTPQNWDESTLTFSTTGDELTATSIATITDPFSSGDSRSTSFAGLDTVTSGTTVDLTGAAVTAFVQTRFSDNGLVTFMFFNPDSAANRGMAFASSENTDVQVPTLTVDYVPEPSVALLGGLGVLGLLHRRRS